LTSYDLRKFTKLEEYKLSEPIDSLSLLPERRKLVVSGGKVCLCSEIDGEIKTIVEIKPKELAGQLKAEVIRDSTLEHLRFLMNSRSDLVELVDVHIE